MDYSNEETLIQGIRNREDAAFEHLHRTCFQRILYIARSSGGDEEDAKDLYNDGIVNLIHLLDQPEKPKFKVRSLFCSICYNRNGNNLKRQKLHDRYHSEYSVDNSYEEQFDEDMDSPLLRGIFWSSFWNLKEKCQELINKVLADFTTKSIAHYLGLSVETARKRKQRCQVTLMEHIRENPEYINLRKSYELPEVINLIKKM